MKRTSVTVLVVLAIGVGVLSHAVLTVIAGRAPTPVPVSALTAVLLAALAIVLWRLGTGVKRLVNREETSIDALSAARVAMASKACSYGGSGLLGYFLAQVVIALPHLGAPWFRQHAIVAAVSALACLALVVVALIVESWCANPPEDDDESGSGPVRGASAA
ncbi:MAG: DUF3180 domain-containing protein [Bowdeniella nasicola]|nr:DUF3180 domain-containing protein [Bowdeniella nasicola]